MWSKCFAKELSTTAIHTWKQKAELDNGSLTHSSSETNLSYDKSPAYHYALYKKYFLRKSLSQSLKQPH